MRLTPVSHGILQLTRISSLSRRSCILGRHVSTLKRPRLIVAKPRSLHLAINSLILPDGFATSATSAGRTGLGGSSRFRAARAARSTAYAGDRSLVCVATHISRASDTATGGARNADITLGLGLIGCKESTNEQDTAYRKRETHRMLPSPKGSPKKSRGGRCLLHAYLPCRLEVTQPVVTRRLGNLRGKRMNRRQAYVNCPYRAMVSVTGGSIAAP